MKSQRSLHKGGETTARKLKEDPEFRKEFCKKVSEATRKAILEKYRTDPDYKKRHAEGTRRSRTKELAEKVSIGLKKYYQDPAKRIELSERAKKNQERLWQTQEYRSKMLPKLKQARENYFKRPATERAGQIKALRDGYSAWLKTPEGEKKRSQISTEIAVRRIIDGKIGKAYTSIENKLAKALENKTLCSFIRQYPIRNNLGQFICLIDIAFPSEKIAVFCDGDYWHANPDIFDWQKLNGTQIRNLRRDNNILDVLKTLDWKVLRFYESEINEDEAKCSDLIERELLLKSQ